MIEFEEINVVGGFGNQGPVISTVWSHDGSMIAMAADQGLVVMNYPTGEVVFQPKSALNPRCVAFGREGNELILGYANGSIKVWDIIRKICLASLVGHEASVYGLSWSPDGKWCASASIDGLVLIWDTRDWKCHRRFEWSSRTDPKGIVLSLDWSSDSSKIAGASYDTIIWDIDEGKATISKGAGWGVYDVAWGRGDKSNIIASATSGNNIEIYDFASGSVLRILEGHTKSVKAVSFSADGKLLASYSDDRTVKIWDTERWSEVSRIRTNNKNINSGSIKFHPILPILGYVDYMVVNKSSNKRSGVVRTVRLVANRYEKIREETLAYVSAKVVLVGESNVGKSYLAHRISTGVKPKDGEIKSTHGMKFWPLEAAAFGHKGSQRGERRELVLWDMGGQDEYRLIHQMFLHDTTLALVLFDPTRGEAAIKEVETWNKALEKQLKGRKSVKLLVGAKVDAESEMIDRKAIEKLRLDGEFAAYCETSAISGRGVNDLIDTISASIDWEDLGRTTRPELFQAIRDHIEKLRKNSVITIPFVDLDTELQTNESLETYNLMAHEVAMASDADAGSDALDGVCTQLAKQGIIARANTSDGGKVLVLRVEEIEKYAGSLILAARKNPRGVPALELRSITKESFHLPQIVTAERLSRDQETLILECTVQLMLEYGICFEHEGLLVFPSLFSSSHEDNSDNFLHSVSLYYDFAGAIDNIYASLIAWLVLAKEFGKVRIWPNRAEFEVKGAGLCGLRRVRRVGGFAHVDVYFGNEMPEQKRKEFVSFVEDHLSRNGVEIREHISIKCECGYDLSEETIRQRIARGDKDVACPVCEIRHSLTGGAAEARRENLKIAEHTWALRTRIEERLDKAAKHAVHVLGESEKQAVSEGPIRILHLSDLHFDGDVPVKARLQWLLDDIKQEKGLGFSSLDYLVISGDFTHKGSIDGFERSYEFVSGLTDELELSAERCIFVPGNHDVCDNLDAYERCRSEIGLRSNEWVKQGSIILARNPIRYPFRIKSFSDHFYHKFLQRPYPTSEDIQGFSIPFWDTGLQFIGLNSCWEIDEFHRKRSGVREEAVASSIREAQKQEFEAIRSGELAAGKSVLRVGVWHHAVAGPDQIKDQEFLGNLQKNGVKVVMHGDVHEMRRDLVGYRHVKNIHVVGAGSFGVGREGLPESTPRLYNLIEISRNLSRMKVHTRCQPKADGPWGGWYEWSDPKGSDGRVPFYEVEL